MIRKEQKNFGVITGDWNTIESRLKIGTMNFRNLRVIFLSRFQYLYVNIYRSLRNSTTQNRLIFQLCFIMLKMKLYVSTNFCEISDKSDKK